jgi:hypothetical protein
MDHTRFMEIEVEGSNDTLLEGIRQITSGIPASRVLTTRAPSSGKASGTAEQFVDDDDDEPQDEEFDAEVEGELPVEQTPRRQRAARSVPKPPEVPKDFDVDSPVSLREFVEKHTSLTKESSNLDMALGLAMWLKEHRNAEIGAVQLYTCCSILRWTLPPDYSSPLRNLKKSQRLAKGSEKGMYALTVVGVGGCQNFCVT